ncbi:MAG: MBL fold metallo-hydrolase [bacterium]|nr:MBL fold metallo-hydrolase [bacterium]
MLLASALSLRAEPGIAPSLRDEQGRFANVEGPIGHGSVGVRLPFMFRRFAASLSPRPGAAKAVANDGAFLRENAKHSTPTVTWIGHASLLVQMDHVTFLTDPNWSDITSPVSFAGPKRLVPPGVALEDLPPIDFVVVSHNHYDHLDLSTLRALAERDRETRFFVPLANAELLRDNGIANVQELDWGDNAGVEGVVIHCLPAQHWSRRGVLDERKALWSSWAVTGPERRFYFAGDTGYFAGFEEIGARLGPFDLAAVPIGAYEPRAMMRESHVNPEEAVAAGIEVGAKRLLGMHFGTFDLADEPLDEPPVRMRAAGRARGLAADDVWILDVEETRAF